MPFVKLDCGMLDSSLWPDFDARIIFVTALLMAEPWEAKGPAPTIAVRDLSDGGWTLPPGWYGFVRSAGSGIVRNSGIDAERGLCALERLASPDPESRSIDYEGRRMVRVDGGYVILNFQKYRDHDFGAKERMRNFRNRKKTGIDGLIGMQRGKCDCCGAPFERPFSKYVVQDHDHSTKANRGLVCQSCNRIIGAIENRKPYHGDTTAVRKYLHRYSCSVT